MATKKYVNLNNLATFLSNLRGVFAALTHTHNLSDIADYVVDSELSPTSTNPLQNKAVSEIINNCETRSDASSKLTEAKSYADTAVDSLTKIYAQPDEPNTPKEGDVWIDTDEDVVTYAEGESF